MKEITGSDQKPVIDDFQLYQREKLYRSQVNLKPVIKPVIKQNSMYING